MEYITKLMVILGIIACMTSNSIAQSFAFQHEASASNIKGNYTVLNHSSINNRTDMVLIVTPVYKSGTMNTSEVAVKYINSRWTIYNMTTSTRIPQGQKFNVLAVDPKKTRHAFVHKTSGNNQDISLKHVSKMMVNPSSNKSNGYALITPLLKSGSKVNNKTVATWYYQGTWRVYNTDKSAMPHNVYYNVVILNKGELKASEWGTSGKSFHHKSTRDYRNTFLGSEPGKDELIFTTQKWVSAYHKKPVVVSDGVSRSYIMSSTSAYKIPKNTGFYVAFIKKETLKIYIPPGGYKDITLATDIHAKINPDLIRTDLVKNPGSMFIIPEKGSGNADAEEEIDTSIKGPNKVDRIEINEIFGSSLGKKLNINHEIFQDINNTLGFYYYLPAKYSLDWDREKGKYAFYIQYLTRAEGEEERIKVTMRLTPNLSQDDIAVAESMLRTKKGKNAILMPMIIEKRDVNLDILKNVSGIDEESIVISLTDDNISDPITIEWIMEGSGAVDDFVNSLFSGLGLSGSINFFPYGDEQENEVYSADIHIQANNEKTFGSYLAFNQTNEITNGFKNPADYPMIVQNIVLLRKKNNGKYTVEAIPATLGDISPNQFSDPLPDDIIRKFQGDRIEKLWIDFDIDDCGVCDEAVKLKLVGGVSEEFKKDLEIMVSPNILEKVEASFIILDVRSPMTAPGGDGKEVYSIRITEDNQEDILKLGGFYMAEGMPFQYEYRITVATDEDFHESEWISKEDSGGMRFLINKSLIETAVDLVNEEEDNDTESEPIDNE